MNKQDKEILLKTLCGYFPYGLKFLYHMHGDSNHNEGDFISTINTIDEYCIEFTYIDNGYTSDWSCFIEMVKPYLRPMSSMTCEEKLELEDLFCEIVDSSKIGITIPPNPTQGKLITFIWMSEIQDWLNAHHFDYRGLIEKGLAIEAPDGMYEIAVTNI